MANPQTNILDRMTGIYQPLETPKAILTMIFVVASDDDRNNMTPIALSASDLFELDEYGDYQPLSYTSPVSSSTYYELDYSNNIMPKAVSFNFNIKTYEQYYAFKTSVELTMGVHTIAFRETTAWQYRVDNGTWTNFPGNTRLDIDPSAAPEDVVFDLQRDMSIYIITL